MKMFEQMLQLASTTKPYEIPIQEGEAWSLRTNSHAIISGNTGQGKSYFVNYLIAMASIKKVNLFLIDAKRSDVASLVDFMPADRVAWESEKICKMAEDVVEIMESRYEYMDNERKRRKLFQADFVDFGLMPIIIVIEEVAAFLSSLEKRSRENFEASMKSLTLQGRQAGVNICSIMQNPGTQNISTEVRSQMGLRVYLGNSSGIEYRMLFGEGYTYPRRIYAVGQGLYMLNGKTEKPEFFEAPRMDKNQLADTLKCALESQFNMNPLPPTQTEPKRSEGEGGVGGNNSGVDYDTPECTLCHVKEKV